MHFPEALMRTTLDVDEELLEKVEELTGEKSPSKAVNRALEEFIRQRRVKKLLAGLGTWDLDLDDWYEHRHQERT
jgi:Arc/MetJ family transcription regulator